MNFVFRSLVVTASSRLARQLREQIGHLRKLVPIESAEAVLEQMSHPHGAFRLQVHLAVPGPDVRAESTGYTLAETLGKMQKELQRRLQLRSRRRADRGLNGRRPVSHRK
jgi:ribosome-associated translation inhibitor RaiA